MGLGKIEDYTKDNLIELYLFTANESQEIKQKLNSSGFTKYSTIGLAAINYRKELKKVMEYLRNDLFEDFNFNVVTNIEDPRVWLDFGILDTLKNGKQYLVDSEKNEVYISMNELINIIKAIDCVPKPKIYHKILEIRGQDYISLNLFNELISMEAEYGQFLSSYFKVGSHNGIFKVDFLYPEFNENLVLKGKNNG